MSHPKYLRPSRETASYAQYMKEFYDREVTTLDVAQHIVAGPDYATLQRMAGSTVDFILNERIRRGFTRQPSELKVLEIGCGVGRLMAGFRSRGVVEIDGVDISEKMIEYAKQLPELSESQFFVSSGDDLGGAPQQRYDLIYSNLVFQHICNRHVRMKLLEQAHKCLSEHGVIVVQMHYYPTTRRETIPRGHAHWTDYQVSTLTSSCADVLLTPDALPDALQDFRAFFADVSCTFVEFPDIALHVEEHPNYKGCPWDHLFISASRQPNLHKIIYRPE